MTTDFLIQQINPEHNSGSSAQPCVTRWSQNHIIMELPSTSILLPKFNTISKGESPSTHDCP